VHTRRICIIAAILAAVALPVAAQDVAPGLWTARPPIHIFASPSASSPTGIFPSQMLQAYGFNQISNQGAGQIVGIVDAYDDPNIEADLAVFSAQFNLPPCTTANGCFTKVYQTGTPPAGNTGWGEEISLDVEWVHAIAPQARIVLVEANSNSNTDLFGSVQLAVANGASVVTMSFGGGESKSESQWDGYFTAPGVVYFASSGDNGHGVEYPAGSPNVVGVGGTTLTIQSDGTYVSESAWNGSGGGTSRYEPEPSYQLGVQSTGKRTVPDISYDANPNTGVPVYDSYGGYNWFQVGGTSMSAPQWAALTAIVNSERVALGKATLNSAPGNNFLANIYTLSADLHDIAGGRNGLCPVCKSKVGYDEVTGLGSPKADLVIPALVALP